VKAGCRCTDNWVMRQFTMWIESHHQSCVTPVAVVQLQKLGLRPALWCSDQLVCDLKWRRQQNLLNAGCRCVDNWVIRQFTNVDWNAIKLCYTSGSSAIPKIGPAPSTVMQWATYNEEGNKICWKQGADVLITELLDSVDWIASSKLWYTSCSSD
jgi:hypothetical protein